ncbi:MAG: UbiD family decarboxylase [Thermodesulfobacteriota bacterium]|jgi:2,5-furandicarboxylate decarboxylase 1
MSRSLRDFLNELDSRGELLRVRKEVDPRFEMAAVMWKLERGQAVLFERVKGYSVPIVGNLLNSRKRIALSLGVEEADILRKCVYGLDHPIEPIIIGDAPLKQVIIKKDINLLERFPIPTFCAREEFPTVTAGLVIVKDPETGVRNVSIIRFRVEGPDWGVIGFAPTHQTIKYFENTQRLGKNFEIAIAIGNHPSLMIASNFYAPLGYDEFKAVGGIFGNPLELVKCETIDVEVPATSEIVIEGEVVPGEFAEEGLFGEYAGFYVNYGPMPILKVKAISHRKNPLLQTVVLGRHAEHLLIGGTGIEATLFQTIRIAVSCVTSVSVGEGGACRHHAVIALKNPSLGEGMRAAFAAFSHYNLLKRVIVVDDDIDVHDPIHVEWAMTTRTKAERDIAIIPNVKTAHSDPMAENGKTIAKSIIIALKDPYLPAETYELAVPPQAIREEVEKNWREYIE